MKQQSTVFFGLFVAVIALVFIIFPELKNQLYTNAEIDSIGHLFSFFCLSWLFYGIIKLDLMTTAIGLIIYGGLTEIGQYYLGFRNGEWSDFISDALGVTLFSIIVLSYQQYKILTKKK